MATEHTTRPAVSGPIPGAPEPPARAAPPAATTPSQTVGPFFHLGLPWDVGPHVVPEGTAGAVRIHGRVTDGAGAPVPDAMLETWQADAAGRFAHPDDPRGAAEPTPAGFRGFGRTACDADGRFALVTVLPGRVPFLRPGQGADAADGTDAPVLQAPHLDVSIFARGLLKRLVTRWYFGDQGLANAEDPVLGAVAPDRRATLIAEPDAQDPPVDGHAAVAAYRIDVRLQGRGETVFFDL